MTTVTINVIYPIEAIPGDTPEEQLDNLLIPMSAFIADMQILNCEVTMSINGQQTLPIPQTTPEKEQAS